MARGSPGALHGDSQLRRLLHTLLCDAPNDHRTLVQHFGPLGGGADQDPAEAQHGAFLAEGSAVAEDDQAVHLQTVVIEEAEGREVAHQRVKLEMPLPDKFHAARMRGIDHRHLIDLGHVVDGLHQGKEVFLDVDVFLAVGS